MIALCKERLLESLKDGSTFRVSLGNPDGLGRSREVYNRKKNIIRNSKVGWTKRTLYWRAGTFYRTIKHNGEGKRGYDDNVTEKLIGERVSQ